MTEIRSYPSTIAVAVEHELVIKKSRFLTHAHPLQSPADVDVLLTGIRKTYWDAAHNCLALVTGVLGDQARSSDDGEPSGTAGMPMLKVLRHRGLTDVLVVVTRYFGGVKLGAGGLVRAYSSAVSEALDEAVLVRREALVGATVAVAHADAGRFDNLLRAWAAGHGATMGEPAYGEKAVFEVWVPPQRCDAFAADVAAASAGAVSPVFGPTRIVDVR